MKKIKTFEDYKKAYKDDVIIPAVRTKNPDTAFVKFEVWVLLKWEEVNDCHPWQEEYFEKIFKEEKELKETLLHGLYTLVPGLK